MADDLVLTTGENKVFEVLQRGHIQNATEADLVYRETQKFDDYKTNVLAALRGPLASVHSEMQAIFPHEIPSVDLLLTGSGKDMDRFKADNDAFLTKFGHLSFLRERTRLIHSVNVSLWLVVRKSLSAAPLLILARMHADYSVDAIARALKAVEEQKGRLVELEEHVRQADPGYFKAPDGVESSEGDEDDEESTSDEEPVPAPVVPKKKGRPPKMKVAPELGPPDYIDPNKSYTDKELMELTSQNVPAYMPKPLKKKVDDDEDWDDDEEDALDDDADDE